jgi:hypothetical protein
MIRTTTSWKQAARCVSLFLFFPLFFLKANIGTVNAKENVCRLVIQNSKGEKVPLSVEIADNEFRRRKGLMFRQTLPQNAGMLFVFDYEQRLSFWMKNTYIPLSIAFIDSAGVIREIYDMRPLDETNICASKHAVRYALEVNRGWFAANNIATGSKVYLHGCIGK